MYDCPMDRSSADVSVFVLAGGKSTRMGADKAFVVLDGRTLLARALELGRSLSSDVRIMGEAAKFRAFGPVVEDIFRDCGPLGGIHAALRATSAELNVMLAVDSPFVTQELLEFLIGRARDSRASVTVPQCEGRLQPLCAVYRRKFADVAEKALQAGRLKIGALFDSQTAMVIGESELQAAGFSAATFRNLNTPKELAAVSSVLHR
jgi:molybdopterin-guanine dinucleotide biosynthesis protein A